MESFPARIHIVRRVVVCLGLSLALVSPLRAQLVIKLSPQTVAEFEKYAAGVESQLQQRWQGKKAFLSVEEDSQTKQQVLDGEIFIKQMNSGHPLSISNGLIHDWLGAIYIPKASIEQVVGIIEGFDKHQKIYRAVTDSKLLGRDGDRVTGYWRLQQRGLVTVVFDVQTTVQFVRLAQGKWKGQSYAKDITEVDTGLFSRDRKFPAGEGHGYLWRLYGYWTLESLNGGVLAECRTLSLSRDIPSGLAWAVAPYVQKQPQQSLSATLKSTRDAVAHDRQ